jgi:hypothetical protein
MKKHLLPHILIISFVLLCNFGCSSTTARAFWEGVAEGLLEAYIGTEKAGSAYKSYIYDVSGYNQNGVYVWGNVDVDQSDGDGYINYTNGDYIFTNVYWIGKGELEGYGTNGDYYTLVVD